MKVGATLVSTIELVNIILSNNKKTKYEINSFFRKRKYAGSKDRKKIQELVFKFLKNYYSLQNLCNSNLIKFSNRNAILFYFFYKNKEITLDQIYEGKFSILPKSQDRKIYKLASCYEREIFPSLPNWLEKKLNVDFKKNLKENYKSILEEPRFDIRINSSVTSREKILSILDQNNIASNKSKFSPLGITIKKRTSINKIKLLKKNNFEIQDEGSQIVTILSGASKGMRVLDYCAGKGTKTIAIHNELEGEGEIFVYDKDQYRINFLEKRFDLLNIKNRIKLLNDTKKFRNYFDLILLDVPCTGSGIWRRRPEAMIKLTKDVLNKNKQAQENLLIETSKFCKKNGIISYITCSIFEDENESQVKKFIHNNKAFKILDIKKIVRNKISNFQFQSSCKWLTISPCYFNSDSFFICLLKKYV